MASLRTYLETRVARRVFGLFLVCAVVPAVCLAASGYWLFSGEMRSQAGLQLAQASKISGTLVLARLHAADEDLMAARDEIATARRPVADGHRERFQGLWHVDSSMTARAWWGTPPGVTPPVTSQVRDHLRQDGAALILGPGGGAWRLYLVRNLVRENPAAGQLWAEISPKFLWGGQDAETVAPAGFDLCVFAAAGGEPVYCSSGAQGIAGHAREWQQGQRSEIIRTDDAEFVAGSSTVYLGFEFAAAPWTVVLEQPLLSLTKASDFGRTLLLTLLIGLGLVTFASNVLLRQRLDPVARLQAGTRRLAQGDFSASVDVATGDEFQDLATSFNAMAMGLREQFELLAALQAVDREALQARSDTGIVAAAVERLEGLLPRCSGLFVLVARRSEDLSTLTSWSSVPGGELKREERRVASSEVDRLRELPVALELPAATSWQGLLGGFSVGRSPRGILLPLQDHGVAFGMVVLTLSEVDLQGFATNEIDRLRQLVDQLALALSHHLVLERLSAMSWGTLQTLARTIDAVSPWTAGHSERVTHVAMAIGRQMALGSEQIERLHRGGLLHDLGKIGVPAVLLDKPGPLTEEELAVVRAHPVTGARILQPIDAFGDVIGIVRHHHERFDGDGYPDRLAGEAIPLLARVLAVADVYDALISDRPYRQGWDHAAAVRHITSRAGHHFDPEVVNAFLKLVEQDEWAALGGGVLEDADLQTVAGRD